MRNAVSSAGLRRALLAIAAIALVVGDAVLFHAAPAGIIAEVVVFWLLLLALVIAIVPRYALTHAVVVACVLAGWPVAFGAANMAAVGCGSGNLAVDVLAFASFLVPFFALLVPVWTPIPIACGVAVGFVAIGVQRVARPQPRWWVVAVALASVMVVAELSRWYLTAHGVHPTGTPCVTM